MIKFVILFYLLFSCGQTENMNARKNANSKQSFATEDASSQSVAEAIDMQKPLISGKYRARTMADVYPLTDSKNCTVESIALEDNFMEYPKSSQFLDFNGHYMFAMQPIGDATAYSMGLYNLVGNDCILVKEYVGSDRFFNVLKDDAEYQRIRIGKLFFKGHAVSGGVESGVRIELFLSYTDGGAEQTKPELIAPFAQSFPVQGGPIKIQSKYKYPNVATIGQLLGVKKDGILVSEIPYQDANTANVTLGEFNLNPKDLGIGGGDYEIWIRHYLRSERTGHEFWSDALILKWKFVDGMSFRAADYNCNNLSPQVLDFQDRMINHPNQKRNRSMWKCDSTLQREAMYKAIELSKIEEFSHVLRGFGPNYRIQHANEYEGDTTVYLLPGNAQDRENKTSNSIESLAAGASTAESAFNALHGSSSHRRHILAEIDFFVPQTDYGIGFFHNPAGKYQYYWVILTANH